jgi:anti-sigma factor RsiW
MKHPNLAALALHAGGDLAPLARWRVGRHLAKCASCRRELAAFGAAREILPEMAAIPEAPWNRLAAEMKANIRLGLAAGECVRAEDLPAAVAPPFAGVRAAVAFASVIALVAAGLFLERPAQAPDAGSFLGAEVRATANGIQVRGGGGALQILNPGVEANDVNYTPDAQGSMRARYVDPGTGYVTVTDVYAN